MTLLEVGVALVAGISVLNLLFVMAVTRRLREHEDRLGKLSAGPKGDSPVMMAPGNRPGAFSVTSTEGHALTEDSVKEGNLIGFFLAGCTPCQQLMPDFIQAAAQRSADRNRPIAVVSGFPDEDNDYVRALRDVAHVVIEDAASEPGTMTAAFEVKGYPAVCKTDAKGDVAVTDRTEALKIPAQV